MVRCVPRSLPACVVSPCTVGLTRALLLAPTSCAVPCAAAVTVRLTHRPVALALPCCAVFTGTEEPALSPSFLTPLQPLHLLLPSPFPPWLLPFSVSLSQALAAQLRLALDSQLSCPCSSVLGSKAWTTMPSSKHHLVWFCLFETSFCV